MKVKNNNKLKLVAQILISILLLVFSALLLFSYKGKMLQSQLFGQYVNTQSQIYDTYISEYKSFGGKTSQNVHELRVFVKVNYSLNNKSYYTSLNIKSFPTYDSEEAEEFALTFKEQHPVLEIYYDPDDPNEIVLNKEDEPFLIISFGVLFLWTFLVITLCIKIPELLKKNTSAPTLKDDVLKQKKAELEKLKELQAKEELKWINYEFLNYSDHELIDLYYKGAITAQAIQQWQWDFATIFLMEKSIIIVFDEMGHYRINQYSFEAFLTKTDSLFGYKVAEEFQGEVDELFEQIATTIKEKKHE